MSGGRLGADVRSFIGTAAADGGFLLDNGAPSHQEKDEKLRTTFGMIR